MQTSALFDFSKYMVYPHGQGGMSLCGYFSDNEGGERAIFQILCERLVWTAPNYY